MLVSSPIVHQIQQPQSPFVPGKHATGSTHPQRQHACLHRLGRFSRKLSPRHQAAHASGKARAADRASTISSDGDTHTEHLTSEQTQKRLSIAADLIKTAHELAPFDRQTFNAALLIW